MAHRNFSNIAVETTLSSGIDADDTTLTVADATGWPAAPFTAILEEGTASEEIIEVGAKAGNVFSSITRGVGGTSGAVHSGGTSTVKHVGIAADLDAIYTHDHDGDPSTQINHDNLTGVSADDHHAEAHNLASHSDTDVTGTQLNTLAGGAASDADALHTHGAIADALAEAFDMIRVGGDSETISPVGIGTSYATGASVAFTKPAGWTSYQILAWGVVNFRHSSSGSASATGTSRIVIDGNNGPEINVSQLLVLVAGFSGSHSEASPMSMHQVSGLTDDAVIQIDYKKTGSGTLIYSDSSIAFIAVRTS